MMRERRGERQRDRRRDRDRDREKESTTDLKERKDSLDAREKTSKRPSLCSIHPCRMAIYSSSPAVSNMWRR